MSVNIPETQKNRIVIIGAGFGGLKLARELIGSGYQIVLIDKNNYHQFQPLSYQVASSGIEPSSILFPLRKIFQKRKDVYVRVTEVNSIDFEGKLLLTNLGPIWYDYLVIATGVISNFFGMKTMEEFAFPMKSVSEAMLLRNRILTNLEKAVTLPNDRENEKRSLLNIAVVGGGPTGVEIAGAIAEMKKFVLPKDYPDLNLDLMQVNLIEGQPFLLANMSVHASTKAEYYLNRLGVNVLTSHKVAGYDGKVLSFDNGIKIYTEMVIWAAGISATTPKGINNEAFGRGRRLIVDSFSRMNDHDCVFAIGDVALMSSEKYPNGHPQIAQVAIQQGANLARNFKALQHGKSLKPFEYADKGAMATIGRNRAVVDLPFLKFSGLIAWFTWMFVHLMAIVGVKNRLLIFVNWMWNYLTYDQSLRLILWAARREKEPSREHD